jgi:hypothetical protein
MTTTVAMTNDDLHTLPTLTGVVVPPELELPTSRGEKMIIIFGFILQF